MKYKKEPNSKHINILDMYIKYPPWLIYFSFLMLVLLVIDYFLLSRETSKYKLRNKRIGIFLRLFICKHIGFTYITENKDMTRIPKRIEYNCKQSSRIFSQMN
jgi:hypothetical protein